MGVEQVASLSAAEGLDDEHVLLAFDGYRHWDAAVLHVQLFQRCGEIHWAASQFGAEAVGVVFAFSADRHLDECRGDWGEDYHGQSSQGIAAPVVTHWDEPHKIAERADARRRRERGE